MEPQICLENAPGAVSLPPSGDREPCPPCNPGFYNNDTATCSPCPPGTYSDGMKRTQLNLHFFSRFIHEDQNYGGLGYKYRFKKQNKTGFGKNKSKRKGKSTIYLVRRSSLINAATLFCQGNLSELEQQFDIC